MRFSPGSRGRVRRVACARRPGAQPGQPCGGGGVTQAAGSAAIMIIIARQYFSLSEVNVTVTVSEELTCIVKFTIMTQSYGPNTLSQVPSDRDLCNLQSQSRSQLARPDLVRLPTGLLGTGGRSPTKEGKQSLFPNSRGY